MRDGQAPRIVDYCIPMNGIGARIKEARKAAGLTQEALAARCGWEGNSRIGNYEKGIREPNAADMALIATATGESAAYLWTGERPAANANVSDLSRPYGQSGVVPVISWVRAGAWDEASDPLHPGDAEDWRPCPVAHGVRTYALRVVGDSMTAPYGKSYPDGCLIFVDPDRLDPPNNTPIIAKVNGDNGVNFKVIVKDAGRIWLKALNPGYPPIMDKFRVLGTVIGKWEDP